MKRKGLKTLALYLLFTSLTSCGGNKTDLGDYVYNTYISTNPKTWNVHNWQTSDESYVNSFTEIGLYDTIMNSSKNGYEIVCEMAEDFPSLVDSSEISVEERQKYYKGNIPDNAVWQIKLNQAAKWENGEAINADTYVESLKRLLDPAYANYRADSFYNSTIVVANAEGYYKQGRSTIEAAYEYVNKENGELTSKNACTDGQWYLNIGRSNPIVSAVFSGIESGGENDNIYTVINNRGSKSTEAVELAGQRINDAVNSFLLDRYKAKDSFYSSNQSFYDNNNSDWENANTASDVKKEMILNHPDIPVESFDEYEVAVRTEIDNASIGGTDGNSNKEIYSSEKLYSDLQTFVSKVCRITNAKAARYSALYCSIYNDSKVDWDNVGFKKIDDYTIRFYLTKSISLLDFEFAMSSNWIV